MQRGSEYKNCKRRLHTPFQIRNNNRDNPEYLTPILKTSTTQSNKMSAISSPKEQQNESESSNRSSTTTTARPQSVSPTLQNLSLNKPLVQPFLVLHAHYVPLTIMCTTGNNRQSNSRTLHRSRRTLESTFRKVCRNKRGTNKQEYVAPFTRNFDVKIISRLQVISMLIEPVLVDDMSKRLDNLESSIQAGKAAPEK